ncbi:hypothetical protein K0817_015005 [Microbacterium sp. HD4P20]|uniref:hypothetical protein n=1 Tax=Microbacterium sp. HD4P20 TaxID=2864874 RepID=UPI001C63EBAD|nr:hypothetical protein [Microbacterium sp. HD4P20]MCP2637860.1 hypothetical protein [Microbacterium sp. HD4P20]
MAHNASVWRIVAPTEHKRDAERTADPAQGTDRGSMRARPSESPERRRIERAQQMPADRHE